MGEEKVKKFKTQLEKQYNELEEKMLHFKKYSENEFIKFEKEQKNIDESLDLIYDILDAYKDDDIEEAVELECKLSERIGDN